MKGARARCDRPRGPCSGRPEPFEPLGEVVGVGVEEGVAGDAEAFAVHVLQAGNEDFVRDGLRGNGAARSGNTRWRRLTELRAGAAKSVFHFDCQGSVAKSTHAGLPWLRYLRQRVGHQTHFWPFDGWAAPADRSLVVEVYPRLWSRGFPRGDRTGDQHDAWSVAEWLRRADQGGTLADYLDPGLTPAERMIAQVEGWILGVR